MKRANNLVEKAADLSNLYLAFWKASKGKRYAAATEQYRQHLEDNLLVLRESILKGEIQVGDYQYFKIFDPKEREICAAAFREQVLHHALMNVCHDKFERAQNFDSYASRVGKGTHAAVKRAQVFTRRYDYFLKLDVRKFFGSLSHEVMQQQMRQLFKETQWIKMFDTIINSYEFSPKRGVPIGNLTSQYMANHYLSSLDRFIKEDLKIKGYVRYMDDMVLWDNDKNVLKKAEKAIETYLETVLRSELKPTLLNHSSYGLPFLGYLIFPYQIKLSERSKKRFFTKMNDLTMQLNLENWNEITCQRHVRPLLAFIDNATVKHLKTQFNHLLTVCKQSLQPTLQLVDY